MDLIKVNRWSVVLLLLTGASLCAAEFVEVPAKEFPEEKNFHPKLAVPYPEGTVAKAFENHGNHWALAPGEKKGQRALYVLNARKADKWTKDTLTGIKDGKWRWLEADNHGYVWISDGSLAGWPCMIQNQRHGRNQKCRTVHDHRQ